MMNYKLYKAIEINPQSMLLLISLSLVSENFCVLFLLATCLVAPLVKRFNNQYVCKKKVCIPSSRSVDFQ